MTNKINKVCHIIYYCQLFFMIFAAIMIYNNCNYVSSRDIHFGSDIDFSTGWYDDNNKEVDVLEIQKKNGYSTKSYKTVYHKIDDNVKEGDSICFRGLSIDLKLYIDDELVLQTPYTDYVFSCKSSGSVWYFYKFKEDDIGKTIKLKIRNYYDDKSCYIASIKAGDSTRYLYNFLKENVLNVVLYALIIIIGLGFVIADLYINHIQKLSSHTLLYMGLFATVIGVYCFVNSTIAEMLLNGSQMWQFLSCNLLYLAPFLGVQVIRNLYTIKQIKVISYLSIFDIAIYFLAWVLQLFNIADFHETVFMSHFSIIVSAIILAVLLKINNDKSSDVDGKKSKKRQITDRIVFSVIVIFGALDMILYYTGVTHVIGFFTSIDIFIMIVYLGNIAFKNIFKLSQRINHAKFVEQLAYKDGLTSVGNRTAYKEYIMELKKNIDKYASIGIVIFDVNNLKTINDTYGHQAGDEVIIGASNVIKQSFISDFKVFRTGGDEFAVIVAADNAAEIIKIARVQFKNVLSNFNNTHSLNYRLSIAYGSDIYTRDKDKTLDEVISSADSNMYINKREYKDANTNAG